ncbi:hypothetical protein BpHYR1_045433 [Brachionus plicatilis]|uniref:Uncharacterized protein n=1 Tax=Brachionus plicatilis TaxID=10195 RepID=A0A3M7PKH9_BRAPC|nr:hypothetical protein BpHYR1_045433 [Brachionus plicatilis]
MVLYEILRQIKFSNFNKLKFDHLIMIMNFKLPDFKTAESIFLKFSIVLNRTLKKCNVFDRKRHI